MPHRPALHEDNRVVSVLPRHGCGQSQDKARFRVPNDLPKAVRASDRGRCRRRRAARSERDDDLVLAEAITSRERHFNVASQMSASETER